MKTDRQNIPILCADDNPFDIELFKVAFSELDGKHRIDVARDGQEVLDYLFYRGEFADRNRELPAAILLDIKMPRLDGIEALRAIRALEDYRELPIIMITSSEMTRDVIDCYELGANAYVVKPIDFNDFVSLVESLYRFWTYLNKFPES